MDINIWLGMINGDIEPKEVMESEYQHEDYLKELHEKEGRNSN